MSAHTPFTQRYTHHRPLILSGQMDELCSWLAFFMFELCKRKHAAGESFCFSPPTGGTPERLYEMIGSSHRGDMPFDSRDTFLALDNYHLPPGHPQGYDTEIVSVLESWGLNGEQLKRLPYESEVEAQKAALDEFDSELDSLSIDVQGLGIGDDGHIAFRLRPEQRIDQEALVGSCTELVVLDANVRGANARFFDGSIDAVPHHALTRGLHSILAADWIWILANNIKKANPIYTAVSGAVGPHCPASYLRLHPRVLVLVADDAAGPFDGDPRVRRRMPGIEALIDSGSCGAYLDTH